MRLYNHKIQSTTKVCPCIMEYTAYGKLCCNGSNLHKNTDINFNSHIISHHLFQHLTLLEHCFISGQMVNSEKVSIYSSWHCFLCYCKFPYLRCSLFMKPKHASRPKSSSSLMGHLQPEITVLVAGVWWHYKLIPWEDYYFGVRSGVTWL